MKLLTMYKTVITLTLILCIPTINSKTCCTPHQEADLCASEGGTGSPCKWLDPIIDASVYAQSSPIQCVNVAWAACKSLQPDDPCIPLPDYRSVNLLGPDETPDDCTTVPQPTLAPTFEPCVITNDFNVQFIIVESGANTNVYANSIHLISRLIDNTVTKTSKISTVAFSKDVTFLYSFDWEQTDERERLKKVLDTTKNNYAGKTTDTYNAILTGYYDFKNSASVKETDKNIMVIISDGDPYCASNDVDCRNPCQSVLLRNLRKHNIRIVIVGNSDGFAEALHCFALPTDIFKFETFNSDALVETEGKLREHVLCTMQRYNGGVNIQSHVIDEDMIVVEKVPGANSMALVHESLQWKLTKMNDLRDIMMYALIALAMGLFGFIYYICKRDGKGEYYLIDNNISNINNESSEGYSTFSV